jgi:hypothetical protein
MAADSFSDAGDSTVRYGVSSTQAAMGDRGGVTTGLSKAGNAGLRFLEAGLADLRVGSES